MEAVSYSIDSSYRRKQSNSEISRRESLARSITTATTAYYSVLNPSKAEAAKAAAVKINPLPNIIEARDTLDTLLTNYKRATIDCTYADVPRELLEAKNKELLLEKASTFALFDKSVSVETCKTTNRVVRDYLGVTGKGPLVQIEKQIKIGLEYVDPDDMENYVSELEKFSQAYSKASSLSYTAGMGDLDSVNNFSKDDAQQERNENSNLAQTKVAISEAKTCLDKLVAMLEKGEA
ncbi:MAG: hypothetical protein SGARI_004842 [Bacillariaceae sp.]